MEKKLSRFATALRALLDSGVLRRVEWAEVLGVTESAISQWVNDSAIPQPKHLRAIIGTILADRRVPSEPLEAFERLAQQPATEVSPNGDRMLPTIEQYMVRPVREGFLRSLEILPPHVQEQVLFESAARCRALRLSAPDKRTVEQRRRSMFEDLIDTALASAPVAKVHADQSPVPTAPIVDPAVTAMIDQRYLHATRLLKAVLVRVYVDTSARTVMHSLAVARLVQREAHIAPLLHVPSDRAVDRLASVLSAAAQSGRELGSPEEARPS